MIGALDSAFPPNDEQLAAAAAAGVQCWAGYFDGPNIMHGWTQSDFERVLAHMPHTIAYCSGHADPAAMRAQSDAWGVPIALDVENGIRGDGDWVEPWLAAAAPCAYYSDINDMTGGHLIGHAAAVIVATRTSDPGATWPWWLGAPVKPHGNQWQGSHTEFGADVDRCWFDEAIFTVLQKPPPQEFLPMLSDQQQQELLDKTRDLYAIFFEPYENSDGTQGPAPWSNVEVQRRQLADLGARENPSGEIPYARPVPPKPVASPEPPFLTTTAETGGTNTNG